MLLARTALRARAAAAAPAGAAARWLSTGAPAASVVAHPPPPGAAAADPEGRFAVVRLGAAQYKVTEGDVVVAEKLKGAEVGTVMPIDDVLLVGTPAETLVGRPNVPGAVVHALVEEQTRDAKVIVFKKKRRKGYKRKHGHRRDVTVLRVVEVEVPSL